MLCSVPLTYSQQGDGEEIFFKANQAYKDGRFAEAVDGYTELLKMGHGNGHLFFNLGNAFFRLGSLGRAVLNYERARLLIPRDADLVFNLSYVRDQLQDDIEEDSAFLTMAFFWTRSMTLKELFLLFAIINIMFWAILFVRIFKKGEWTYYTTVILLIFWIIGGMSFGLKQYWISSDDRAVILEKEVDILAGPDPRDTILFKLHEGAIVHHERSEDGWSLISLSQDKRGWMKSEALEKIKMDSFSIR